MDILLFIVLGGITAAFLQVFILDKIAEKAAVYIILQPWSRTCQERSIRGVYAFAHACALTTPGILTSLYVVFHCK